MPAKDTSVEMCARRGLFYADIKTVNVYGLGWYRRQCKVLREAFEIIDSDTTRSPAASEPVPTHDPTPPQKPTILGGLFKRYRS